ncbi:MAG: hypothetical protein R3D63_10510 [Paracoccaceae bacterium]
MFDGAFRVLMPDGTDCTPGSALRQALLAVLVLSPGQVRTRIMLQSMFWGDSGNARAAASLRTALYMLRRDLAPLGADPLLTDRVSVRLAPNRLTQGPFANGPGFLEGMDLSLNGCEGFEAWLRQMRTPPDLPAPTPTPTPAQARQQDATLPATPADPGTATGTGLPRLALLCPKSATGHSLGDHLATRVISELANGLAAWRSFAVLAPQSSFAVESDFGIPDTNLALRADYSLSGHVEPGLDDHAAIALRLVNLASRTILWSGRFPLTPSLIGPALDRFTARIVATIGDRLEDHQRKTLLQKAVPSALLCYLQGRATQQRSDLPYVRKARAAFQRALSIDAGFAPAHARIAETLYVEWVLRGGGDADLLLAARDRARRAVDLDPTEPTGHWVSGAVALYRRKFDAVAAPFDTACDLAPHDCSLILEHADALSHLGDHSAAETRFRQALDLNPLPPDNLWWVGVSVAFHAGDFALAAARCDRMRKADVGVGLRAASYAMADRPAEAGYWSRRLDEVLPDVTPEELSAFPPNRDRESYCRNYTKGLRLARSAARGTRWQGIT